ncbi:class II aldolase/adducin family protein [Amycolatopsis regifaucium]|uniref:Ribulose phosphate epimerase n=1 Tax=Amycolatopsis regifaucium TaxID=546365 RepID=A0A154MER4_9PSEU|nr:class II aldolase/adducin family protein [Amycolatopsis regifaucium]KZB83034.1 ribulose phosphate epimerase [Amycolatopsis regifaucium]OKA03432.1 ribulose phosphate epimerase [Amycolatopsis regifaucium]SFJ70581.1 L-fuculose-phosphate aldolase [Amycolatopsis regifaucium]
MPHPRRLVTQACHVLAAAGLGDLVWGHASVRDPDGRGVWMKPSGWGFEEITEDKVILVARDGTIVDGDGARHLEYPIHTEIMAARPDVGAVVHTHAPTLAAFASLEVELKPLSHDAVPFAYPQIPRFTDTGALIAGPELGRALARCLGPANGVLIPNHGAVTAGPDIQSAVMYAVLLERACRTQLMAIAAHGPARWSDELETRFKRDQVWNPGQLHAGWEYLVRKASEAFWSVSRIHGSTSA